jgi:CBS domain-containing protein
MICPFCRTQNIEGADECANCGQALYGLDLPGGVKGGAGAPDFILEPISRLTKREALTVGADYPVAMAVKLMQNHNSSCVMVTDDAGSTVGIITGTDILLKVAAPAADLNALTCRQIMTPDPVTHQDEDSIAIAVNAMAAGSLRHIPIVREGRLAGVIDVNDVFSYISPNLV